jgi:hypothetical protein
LGYLTVQFDDTIADIARLIDDSIVFQLFEGLPQFVSADFYGALLAQNVQQSIELDRRVS